MTTDYHARYFAHELTRRRAADGIGRLSQSLFDACVDLNPHQIEAAMFALRSPADNGVILADEVGLGKTIEAGVLLCQYWAERRRRLIVVCPASLRRQWAAELDEKFNLPAVILDARTLAHIKAGGTGDPFGAGTAVLVMSYNFAARQSEALFGVPWDLVVIDEAHKLRNVHKPGNVMGQRIKRAFSGRRKVLLTATPLQNSLMELYGLASLIDAYAFGDQAAFRAQFVGAGANLEVLRGRLLGFCHRTLRSQVQEYVRYTERRPITIPFTPSDPEQALYDKVSAFLLRGASFAIPQRQRQLTVLVLRKLLASSSCAIAGTLETVLRRLEGLRDGQPPAESLIEDMADEEELEDDYLDEPAGDDPADDPPANDLMSNDQGRLEQEIAELRAYVGLARSIGVDTKCRALLTALDKGFAETARTGAARKALVFTESRRTQDYLKAFLETNGYAGKVIAFNGSNTATDARAILTDWLKRNEGTGRATGSRPVDVRTALVEHFRDQAEIMLATEAAAEGINLQFCSLVINYDLPWNPQRVEQRIGRCHRYGQKHDVVVVNFLNQRNAADRRVFQLLDEKFALFKGIFGASDEVLGTIESGLDFEKRILAIYQQCRTEAEIDAAFARLQAEMDESIRSRLCAARQLVFAHFDEDVHARLKLRLDDARLHLDRTSRMFWWLTRHVLGDRADFDDANLIFRLTEPPLPALTTATVPVGTYHLISKDRENAPGTFLYRLGHPLGEWALEQARDLPTPMGRVAFDIRNHPTRITVVETLLGLTGWLSLHRVTLDSFEREEFLVFSAIDRRQQPLDPEVCEKLFACAGVWRGNVKPPHDLIRDILEERTKQAIDHTLAVAEARNARFLEEQRLRLERWADDKLYAAEKELNDIKARLKDLARRTRQTTEPAESLAIQHQIQDAEKAKRRARQRIFDAEDAILEERDRLIQTLKQRLNRQTNVQELFTIQWEVV